MSKFRDDKQLKRVKETLRVSSCRVSRIKSWRSQLFKLDPKDVVEVLSYGIDSSTRRKGVDGRSFTKIKKEQKKESTTYRCRLWVRSVDPRNTRCLLMVSQNSYSRLNFHHVSILSSWVPKYFTSISSPSQVIPWIILLTTLKLLQSLFLLNGLGSWGH